MRIGMLVDIYKPHISGVTNYIVFNKRMLELAGHEVFVFTFGGLDYEDDEPNIIRSPKLPLVVKGHNFNIRYSRTARKLVQTMDVVHVHHPFFSGPLALLYCKPKNIPIVFTNHTRYDLYVRAYVPFVAGITSLFSMRIFLPIFARQIDLFISPSPGMREVLIKSGVRTPIDVVPNGINLEPFRSVVEPVERVKLGFTDQDVLLIFVGRLGPEKNVAFLLRAFADMVKDYKNAGLMLVGEGPEHKEFEVLVRELGIEKRVHFTGQVPYNDMPGYLSTADAFVTASVSEVHPFTVIEAMAAGLPVLGINSPGVGDTVQDERSGLLAPSPQPAEFTQRMLRLVKDNDLRRQLGERAKADAELYSIERTNQMMIERYQKVIELARNRKLARSRFSPANKE
jgi:1,2-diacylglycerol 3-alpha-glucosyltransferase